MQRDLKESYNELQWWCKYNMQLGSWHSRLSQFSVIGHKSHWHFGHHRCHRSCQSLGQIVNHFPTTIERTESFDRANRVQLGRCTTSHIEFFAIVEGSTTFSVKKKNNIQRTAWYWKSMMGTSFFFVFFGFLYKINVPTNYLPHHTNYSEKCTKILAQSFLLSKFKTKRKILSFFVASSENLNSSTKSYLATFKGGKSRHHLRVFKS